MANTQCMWIRNISIGLVLCLSALLVQAQIKLVSVPVVGYVTYREAQVMVELSGGSFVELVCKPDSGPKSGELRYFGTASSMWLGPQPSGNVYKYVLKDVVPGTKYSCRFYNGKKALGDSAFTIQTPALWEWRTPAPDFSFVTGSCVYINEEKYDRPGAPYGKSTEILGLMSRTAADFNLWLGDNVYLREADYSSASGMKERYQHTRRHPEVQKLLASRPNYAIWDDHDFGPNNSDRSFPFRQQSLNLFRSYWPNPGFGTAETPGAFCSFKYGDVEFFLMDNRYYRAPNRMDTSDVDKAYWGKGQMNWLKDQLINSKATFKVIVNGNQVVNMMTDTECMNAYPKERAELYEFLSRYEISGVIFLTGDRHFTEMLKLDRPGSYPLYDFTCSPLTSGPYVKIAETEEGKNPLRVEGSLIAEQNFARVGFSGGKNERKMKIEVMDTAGKILWMKEIHQNELKSGR